MKRRAIRGIKHEPTLKQLKDGLMIKGTRMIKHTTAMAEDDLGRWFSEHNHFKRTLLQ